MKLSEIEQLGELRSRVKSLEGKPDVTWTEVKRWWPIFASVITVVFFFSTILIRLSLIEQKLAVIADTLQSLTTKYADVEGRYGAVAIRLTRIETQMNIK